MFLTTFPLGNIMSMLMTRNNLHPAQKRLLDLLIKNIDAPLTIRELQDTLGFSSTSVVAHHLKQLEKKGYFKKNPYNSRDYEIVKDGPEKQITYLNLYGLAHCGQNGSLLDGNPIERIPISIRLLPFPYSNAFLVKARGDSMLPKINDGDLVIAKRSKRALNGTVVVCINNGEALIKKFQKENGNTILISLNPNHPPFLASEDFRIEGEVRGIISHKILQ